MVTGAETGRLMPFVLEPERTGAPPAELFDLGSEIWRSHETYTRWCRRNGLDERPGRNWAERFQRGRDAWAIANGYSTPSGLHPDHRRLLDELHIPWCGSLTRAMAVAEAHADDPEAFRADCTLAPYGDVADRFP